MSGFLFYLTLCAAIGCGLIAGVFFAFSTFVMRALSRLPAASGIAAMQSINVAVLNRWFLGVFFGTAAACAAVLPYAFADWPASYAGWLLRGAVLYLLGTVVVTMVCNVPQNELLATLAPDEIDAERLWREYVAGWTSCNHVRTAAALAAAASFGVALGS